MSVNSIESGMKIEIHGIPYLVLSNNFSKPGKGQAFNTVRLKNFLNGRVLEKKFKSSESLQIADIEEVDLRLLYMEADAAVFMDDKTFEQTSVPFESIEEKKVWLKDDTCYKIVLHDGIPIDIVPPIFLNLKVTQSNPSVRGNTTGAVMKRVLVETGAEILVPGFIKEGEVIKVDTRTGSYASRV